MSECGSIFDSGKLCGKCSVRVKSNKNRYEEMKKQTNAKCVRCASVLCVSGCVNGLPTSLSMGLFECITHLNIEYIYIICNVL